MNEEKIKSFNAYKKAFIDRNAEINAPDQTMNQTASMLW